MSVDCTEQYYNKRSSEVERIRKALVVLMQRVFVGDGMPSKNMCVLFNRMMELPLSLGKVYMS